jgi:hypothetical protein
LRYDIAFPWGVSVLYAGAEKNPLNLNQVMLAEESGTGRHLSDAPLPTSYTAQYG